MGADYRGLFLWFDLLTNDQKGAIEFYSKISGWETELWGEDYTMWTVSGTPLGGVVQLPEEATARTPAPRTAAVDELGPSGTCFEVVKRAKAIRPTKAA